MAVAFDAELDVHLEASVARLERTLRDYAPHVAPALLDWLRGLTPDGRVADYFRHEHRFPMLLLPWWMSHSAGIHLDRRFHEDLVYSTVAGYLAIRLLDDTLDEQAGIASNLLPATVILQAEFQHAYGPYFATDDPFWDLFRRQWYGAADFAFDHEGAHDFERRVARRLGPVLIPLAAVAHRAGRRETLGPWEELLRVLARVEQLLDDITDWVPDAERDAPNLLLALYPERANAGEPLETWMLRDGLSHGYDLAQAWLTDLEAGAERLGSAGLVRFVASRRALLGVMRDETGPGLRELARLRSLLDPA